MRLQRRSAPPSRRLHGGMETPEAPPPRGSVGAQAGSSPVKEGGARARLGRLGSGRRLLQACARGAGTACWCAGAGRLFAAGARATRKSGSRATPRIWIRGFLRGSRAPCVVCRRWRLGCRGASGGACWNLGPCRGSAGPSTVGLACRQLRRCLGGQILLRTRGAARCVVLIKNILIYVEMCATRQPDEARGNLGNSAADSDRGPRLYIDK